jgi:hypothetical protein
VRRKVARPGAGATIALAVGIPTGLALSPGYTWQAPVLWYNHVVRAATAVLGGLQVAAWASEGSGPPTDG